MIEQTNFSSHRSKPLNPAPALSTNCSLTHGNNRSLPNASTLVLGWKPPKRCFIRWPAKRRNSHHRPGRLRLHLGRFRAPHHRRHQSTLQCGDAIDPVDGTIRLSVDTLQIDAANSKQWNDAQAGEYVLIEVMDNGKGMDRRTARTCMRTILQYQDRLD